MQATIGHVKKAVFNDSPLNAETNINETTLITPPHLFFNRNRTEMPEIKKEEWKLKISGNVQNDIALSFEDLTKMNSRSILATLECAGNGRAGMLPMPKGGEPWAYGAVSSAEWTGVPLSTLLRSADPRSSTKEILFTGADDGHKTDDGRMIRYARSLDIRDVRGSDDIILAYKMNGKDIPKEHGFPVRLYVPRMYGMASVKWITDIEAIDYNYNGFYQSDRYIYRNGNERIPVRFMHVRSVISSISNNDMLEKGARTIEGFAWSGNGRITRVEVSVDGGNSWSDAVLSQNNEKYLWSKWHLDWNARIGDATIVSRAYDKEGNSQPEKPVWNELGYGNNAPQKISIRVV